MKKWILTIFGIQPKLPKKVAAIDEKIERIALAPFGSTIEQCAKIIYLSDYKAKLVNMKIMRDVITKRIGEDKASDVLKYASGKSAREIADESGRNQYTVYRRIMRAIEAGTKELEDCGYDEARMDREYGNMKFVAAIGKRLECKLRGDKS